MSGLLVVDGALITCSSGSSLSSLTLTELRPLQIGQKGICHITDHIPTVNIQPCGMCSMTSSPCMPITPTPWTTDLTSRFGTNIPITENSHLICASGGVISIQYAGQSTIRLGLDRIAKLPKLPKPPKPSLAPTPKQKMPKAPSLKPPTTHKLVNDPRIRQSLNKAWERSQESGAEEGDWIVWNKITGEITAYPYTTGEKSRTSRVLPPPPATTKDQQIIAFTHTHPDTIKVSIEGDQIKVNIGHMASLEDMEAANNTGLPAIIMAPPIPVPIFIGGNIIPIIVYTSPVIFATEPHPPKKP